MELQSTDLSLPKPTPTEYVFMVAATIVIIAVYFTLCAITLVVEDIPNYGKNKYLSLKYWVKETHLNFQEDFKDLINSRDYIQNSVKNWAKYTFPEFWQNSSIGFKISSFLLIPMIPILLYVDAGIPLTVLGSLIASFIFGALAEIILENRKYFWSKLQRFIWFLQ